jgi:hypothetical protein
MFLIKELAVLELLTGEIGRRCLSSRVERAMEEIM